MTPPPTGEPVEKRPRTEIDDICEGFEFVSLARKKKVTKGKMEQIWRRVFKCKFPRWERISDKHLMVKGVTIGPNDTKERICLSFWPGAGKWYFQGPDAETKKHIERWNEAFDNLFGYE